MQQHGMATGLFARTFHRINHKHGCFGIRSACNHVPQELAMTGSVHDNIFPRTQFERDTRGVNRNALIAFDLQGIQQKAPFDLQTTLFGRFNNLGNLAVLQVIRVMQQAADQCGFAVVDMPHNNNRCCGILRGRNRITHFRFFRSTLYQR